MIKAWRVLGEKNLVAEEILECKKKFEKKCEKKCEKKKPKKKIWKCMFH